MKRLGELVKLHFEERCVCHHQSCIGITLK